MRDEALIGRDDELTLVSSAIERSRLVTLTGTAGVGKTTLARAVARHAQKPSEFIDLSTTKSQRGVLSAMAHALDLPLLGDELNASILQLGRALAARGPLLLILDNFEQLVTSSASIVPRWLELAPELGVLVTSREALRLPGEVVERLEPLSPSAAVELFVKRSESAGAGHLLVEADTPYIQRIVGELDHVPLAITLAAARSGVLSPAQLLELMPETRQLLHAEKMHSAVAWSWVLLGEAEQGALGAAALFRGGFELDAFAAILDRPPSAPFVIDSVQSLFEKSLLQSARRGRKVRYATYASVRELALERADPSVLSEQRARHARYFIQLGLDAAEATRGPDARDALALLAVERENLDLAAEWALSTPSADEASATLGLQAVLALEPSFVFRGPHAAGIEIATRALDFARPFESSLPARLFGRVLWARGRAFRALGSAAREAEADFRSALALAELADDPELECDILGCLGHVVYGRGDIEDAEACFRRGESRVIDRKLPRALGELMVIRTAAHLATRPNAEVRAELERACRLLADAGHVMSRAHAEHALGVVNLLGRRLEAARGCLTRAKSAFSELGERRMEALALANLAVVHQDLGESHEAETLYSQAISAQERLGDPRLIAYARVDQGTLFHVQERFADARALYQRALSDLDPLQDPRAVGLCRAYLGAVLVALGEHEAAAKELDEAERWLIRSGDQESLAGLEIHRASLAHALGRPEEVEQVLERHRVLGETSREVRLAISLLEARLARARSGPLPSNSTLSVPPGAEWFSVDGAERVRLGNRRALRQILERLVDARQKNAGIALGVDELFHAGWPDERIGSGSRANRVRVALSTLRKLGLEPFVERTANGWRILPNARIETVE